jgi:penicillin-binding protein 1A
MTQDTMRIVLTALAVLALLTTACGRFVEVEGAGGVQLDQPAETSVVLAADGSVLAELHGEQDRQMVALQRMPTALRQAAVAVEDTRFRSHEGVDVRAIGRAFVENTQSGAILQGGSTITQQLVKNAKVGDAISLRRKLEEASVALQLEAEMSKDEILARYLNTVYFGNGAYGVQSAAQRYFGTDVSSLSLAQSALLAGLIKSPADYDPLDHPQAARARRNTVLGLMADQGRITEPKAAAARASELALAPTHTKRYEAPYFVDHVLERLQHAPAFKTLGPTPSARAERLFRGGLRVQTTLQPSAQRAAEKAMADKLSAAGDPSGALVGLEPLTGGIRAMVGGDGYYERDDPTARFNLATEAKRQPGSAFKPLVLAAALANGHSLTDRLPGRAQAVLPPGPGESEPWRVANYGDQDLGTVTLRQATAKSVNVAYAHLIETLGPKPVAALAKRAGIRTQLEPYRSLALGAQEVTPLGMATVAATLAAGGVHREPSAVTRITDASGEVLYERGTREGERVMSETVAWQATKALRGVIENGTGQRADLRRPVAGKTGTTQNSADAWFMGYTPDLASAVWVGFPRGQVPMEPPRTRIAVEGGNWPAEIFAKFGLTALQGVPAHDFPLPEAKLVRVPVDTKLGCRPNPYTPRQRIATRAYPKGSPPTEQCDKPDTPPTADVPDTVGLPAKAAVRVLEGAGFSVTERKTISETLPPGYVARQTPEQGEQKTLAEGFTATMWVSAPQDETVAVPDVLNLSRAEARQRLEKAGLKATVTTHCPAGIRQGAQPSPSAARGPTAGQGSGQGPATTSGCTGARTRPSKVWEQKPGVGDDVAKGGGVQLSVYPELPGPQ